VKKRRFTENQIIAILREAEKGEKTNKEIARAHGVSEYTFYRWKAKYQGMSVADVRRLRQVEKENARLKRLVAERDLEIDAMKDLLSKKW